jgi:hypothetical protein
MLWTERGTVRHAKMLGTDKAWDVQDRLEDCYFAVKEQSPYGLKHPVIDPVYSPIHLTYKMKQQINGAVNYQTGLSGVTQEVIYGNLKREFGYEKIETADITLYPEICQRLGIPASEPIPEYLWVEGVEFKRLRDESAELESLKTDPTPLLICNETELWTKVTNDDVIVPFVEFQKMTDFIESHQQAKDSITQSIKQAFDEIDTSENILVGRQRWNELNFIVKKVMNNPQALAIL